MSRLVLVLAILLLSIQPAFSFTTWTGETGLFSVQTAETAAWHQWKFGAIYNNFERELIQDDPDEDGGNDIDLDYVTFPASFGVTSWWEISGSFGYVHIRDSVHQSQRVWRQAFFDRTEIDEGGVSDVRLNTKFRVLDFRQSGFGAFVSGFVNIGTADESRGLGTGAVDYGVVTGISAALDVLRAHLNLGFRWNGDVADGPIPVDYNDQWIYGLGVEYTVSTLDWITWIFEATGETQVDPRLTDDPFDATAGARIRLNDNWAAQGALRYALGEESISCPWGGMFGIVYKSTPPSEPLLLSAPEPEGIPAYDPCRQELQVLSP